MAGNTNKMRDSDDFEDFQEQAAEFELADVIEIEDDDEYEEEEEEETSTFSFVQADFSPEASKAWRFELSEPEIRAILERGQFGGLKLVPWGSNYTFIAPLCDEETGQEYAAIYKPMRGEAPLWDFPNGTLYKREYGAYLVSKALGWHFIPPVIVRDGPHGIGTVQLFVDVNERQQYYDFRENHAHELKRIALFDYITNNADRKAGHCLLGGDGYIWGIDHGLCFNHVPKMRTIIWDFAGEPIPEDICIDLAELATDSARLADLRAQLRELLERREIDLFQQRLENVLNEPRFPSLTSRRQIPWGFF
ncbi:MAG TPA: SCO1664 family protein [Chloroflexia bacterium]|nr:SCO1664 family protein [Chloroflexia bacterium]